MKVVSYTRLLGFWVLSSNEYFFWIQLKWTTACPFLLNNSQVRTATICGSKCARLLPLTKFQEIIDQHHQ